jgi:hypothetical protein
MKTNIINKTREYLAKTYRFAKDDSDEKIILDQEEQLMCLLGGEPILIDIDTNLTTTFRYAILRFATFRVPLPNDSVFEMRLDVDKFMEYVRDESPVGRVLNDKMEDIRAIMEDLNNI